MALAGVVRTTESRGIMYRSQKFRFPRALICVNVLFVINRCPEVSLLSHFFVLQFYLSHHYLL